LKKSNAMRDALCLLQNLLSPERVRACPEPSERARGLSAKSSVAETPKGDT
jgi:hypothetical protein